MDQNYFIRKHQGKSDLKKSIPSKIKAFSHFHEKVGVVIVQDQDSNDCKILKQSLLQLCWVNNPEIDVLVRIVCRELESWYIGDFDAVSAAYPSFKADTYKRKALFRNPDICNAKNELQKILSEYHEISSAQSIAQHMDIEKNSSQSFNQFITGISMFFNTMN